MSETVNDGGPAFPTPVCEEPHCESCESKSAGTGIFFGGTQGMTLRDYFAAKAMQGMLSTDRFGTASEETIADWAYEQADAMLRAREAK